MLAYVYGPALPGGAELLSAPEETAEEDIIIQALPMGTVAP